MAGGLGIVPCPLLCKTWAGHADQAVCSLGLRREFHGSAIRLWLARGLASLLTLKSPREGLWELSEAAVGAARAEECAEIRP